MAGQRLLKKSNIQETDENAYWMCMIGPVKKSEIPAGGDFPLRMAVRDKFYDMFDPENDVCSSGWGIDEERYQTLRYLHTMDTQTLKNLITIKNQMSL
jgi:hypothetical protein